MDGNEKVGLVAVSNMGTLGQRDIHIGGAGVDDLHIGIIVGDEFAEFLGDGENDVKAGQAAGCKTAFIGDENVGQDNLNAKQKKAISQYGSATVFEAYFESNGSRIHDFGGGKARISVRYSLLPCKAYSWSIIDENPCKRVKAPSKKADVNALQMEDIYKIMERLPEYTDIRAKMFVLLALNTGVREAEAAGLEWRDIDLDNHILHIRRTSQYIPGQGMIESTPKSSSSVRDIPISDALITELMNYHHWQSEQIDKLGDIYEGNLGDKARLFTTFEGRPVYDSTLRKWLTKFLEWCDVPRVTVHGLRHTFASVLIANGTDPRTAADLMGHTSPALVMNTYANPQNEAKKRAIQNLNNIYQNKQAE